MLRKGTKTVARGAPHSNAGRPGREDRGRTSAPRTVSARWLAAAVAASVFGAAVCVWAAMCLLFAQGSWQLLYHPAAVIDRTPAEANVPFVSIAFDPDRAGTPQLSGWLVPAPESANYNRWTVLYLHGQDGNLSGTVGDLAALHELGLNVFAFDYRGYGQSRPAHPSEKRWLQDSEAALRYLTETRHLAPGAIVLFGKNLGANLALEFASAHPDLGGLIVDRPLDRPMDSIFRDPRASLAPARLLVHDRYNSADAAARLRTPSLWFAAEPKTPGAAPPSAFDRIAARKSLVWLPPDDAAPILETRRGQVVQGPDSIADFDGKRAEALSRWLDDLPKAAGRP